MDDQTLLRYSRHILLPEIDISGQEAIFAARILIIGAGGLGCPAALYLAASGVGEILLVDEDKVELSNLQRQILHTTACLGQAKVVSAKTALAQINPDVQITAIHCRANAVFLNNQLASMPKITVVLDCSDNFATRYAINTACTENRIPLIFGAAQKFSGQCAVFDLRKKNAGCYACLFPAQAIENRDSCATTGVFAPLTGIIGALQASEAIKLITQPAHSEDTGKFWTFDAGTTVWRSLKIAKDKQCSVCGNIT